MSFQDLGLRTELLRAVQACGYDSATQVQRNTIPHILARSDVLAGAQTGTGKTAAFTLPILELLSRGERSARGDRPRALVLAPTRELAAQVGESVSVYGQHLKIRSAVVFGGVNINAQIAKVERGLDVLVATPGRLLDLVGRGCLDLGGIEILVLDEADRMLDMGFIHDIRKILALLPAQRQSLMFSATYSDAIRELANRYLINPIAVDIARRNAAATTVEQRVYRIEQALKRQLLATLISKGDWHQVLVFTRTKHGANRLTQHLNREDLQAMAIHGNKSQNARTQALSGFKSGTVRVLVATDIAARGLDIDGLPYVVNFELPNISEDYVHRIGRTGRAGRDGVAVSLVDQEETKHLRAIERLLKRRIDEHELPVLLEQKAVNAAPARSAPESGSGQKSRSAASDEAGDNRWRRRRRPGRSRTNTKRSEAPPRSN